MADRPVPPPCPICNSAEGHKIALYSAGQAAQAFAPRRLDPGRHGALSHKLCGLWQNTHCTLWRCDNCDFVYSDPFVSGDEAFYRMAFPEVSYPSRKWEFDRTREALGSMKFVDPMLLEVGAGNGAFLKKLIEDGWPPDHLQACEFSASGRVAIARLSVNCVEADWRSIDRHGAFDVVCMFQVLEHLDDYEGMFAVLNRIVRPGGHLFVATPNGEWIASNEKRKLLLDMPPNHVSRWSPRAFGALADRFGWHLQACELEPASRIPTAMRVLTDRFVRLVNDEAFWACRTTELAMRTGSRNLGRLIKAAAVVASPACLSAAISTALTAATPQNIWAHLKRPRPAAAGATLAPRAIGIMVPREESDA